MEWREGRGIFRVSARVLEGRPEVGRLSVRFCQLVMYTMLSVT